MKNKKFIALGIALLLFATVTGVVFANPVRGVRWHSEVIGGVEGTRFVNTNNQTVRVDVTFNSGGGITVHLNQQNRNNVGNTHWVNTPIRNIRSVIVR